MRQHQIRVHLADAGFAIVGDKIYARGDDAFVEYCDEGLTPELSGSTRTVGICVASSAVDSRTGGERGLAIPRG